MTSVGLALFAACAVALLLLPRRWAALPLLSGTFLLPFGEGLELSALNLPPLRVLIAVGFLRAIARRESPAGGMTSLDRLLLAWAAWALASCVFHADVAGTLVNRLGLVYNGCGIYFLFRVVCRSIDDVVEVWSMAALLLIPVSLEMLYEKSTGHNLFTYLGDIPPAPESRDGAFRAQGAFAHSILAGSAGGTCLSIVIGLWLYDRRIAAAGIIACCLMIFSSSSSSPIISGFVSIAPLLLWPWRRAAQAFAWLAAIGYAALELIMNAPAYYIISYIDLTGASTSFHRAALIDSALTHLSEWWLGGTDYTRHWLATGVNWSPNQIDVTNYYLRMGVDGGLPLMFLFIATLVKGFILVARKQRQVESRSTSEQFFMWALGAALFSHAATFLAVSYFDQSFVLLYLTLAAICAISLPRSNDSERLQ